jgi:toxin ParE1/3/4
VSSPVWDVQLGSQSEKDIVGILRQTARNFGLAQAAAYKITLLAAIDELHEGPLVAGSIAHDEIRSGLRFLHIARKWRAGRHIIVYRPVDGQIIRILRILHDASDIVRHL